MSLILSPPGSAGEGKTLSVLLLEHKEDLIQCVTQLRPIVEFLETAKEEFLPDSEKRVTVWLLCASYIVITLAAPRVLSHAPFISCHRLHHALQHMAPGQMGERLIHCGWGSDFTGSSWSKS